MFKTPSLHWSSSLFYLFLIFVSVIVAVMGSLLLIRFLTRRRIDVKEEIVQNCNLGIALVLASFIWTIGSMALETIKPIMNVWYGYFAEGVHLAGLGGFIGKVFGAMLLALVIGAFTVMLALKVLMVINHDINEWDEIKGGNTAVAVVMAVTVVLSGLFFQSVVSYMVVNLFGV